MGDFTLDLSSSLDERILKFKSDPERMKELHAFLNELFDKASIEAEKRQSIKPKSKLDLINMQSKHK